MKENKTIKGKTKKITKTVKKKIVRHVSDVCADLDTEVLDFKKHVYYNMHQCNKLKELKLGLHSDEVVFRIDFSENYVCKYSEEIQSAHFGASKKQITLNTGVFYIKNGDGKVDTKSFCTVSDNLDHQAHAIWAHMDPVLKKVNACYPDINHVHFYTDGPSSQYKNRFNIYLMKTNLPRYFNNLQSITWNFTEAGHGKGPMDGVGGVLKRRADEFVRHGNDITCADQFVNSMKNRTKVKLFIIDSSSIDKIKKEVKETYIPPIHGITKAKQITWYRSGLMYSRSLSCFTCKPSCYCDHYTIGKIFANTSKKKHITLVKNYKRKTNRDIVYPKIYSSSSEDEDDLKTVEAGTSGCNVALTKEKNNKPLKVETPTGEDIKINVDEYKKPKSSKNVKIQNTTLLKKGSVQVSKVLKTSKIFLNVP